MFCTISYTSYNAIKPDVVFLYFFISLKSWLKIKASISSKSGKSYQKEKPVKVINGHQHYQKCC